MKPVVRTAAIKPPFTSINLDKSNSFLDLVLQEESIMVVIVSFKKEIKLLYNIGKAVSNLAIG